MILIIGGAFQGKKDYAKRVFSLADEDFTDGAGCEWEAVFQTRAVLHFHEYIRRCLAEGRDTGRLAGELARRNPHVIVLANEVGSGVVPADAFDRNYRETVGRVCCELAGRAEKVCRVACGIGMVIKDG